jgi:phosphoglycerol transferase
MHKGSIIEVRKIIGRFILYFLACLIFFAVEWLQVQFAVPTTEQIIFQVLFLKQSINTVPSNFLDSYIMLIKESFMFASIAIIIDRVFLVLLRSKYFLQKIQSTNIKTFILKAYSLFLKLLRKIDKIFLCKMHIWLLFLSFLYFAKVFSLHSYVLEQLNKGRLFISYINPENINIEPHNSKNLVLIYMESMEDAYKDSDLFGRNLLKSLYKEKGVSFKRYRQRGATGWMIAGIFATQCGRPITASFVEDNHICLSDILDEHGYYNIFMGGTSLEFTRKGDFFLKHKYHEVYGREEWVKRGVQEINEWGAYDEDIFKQAKIRLEELHKKGGLFNLTILTGDTHAPNGYLSEYCKTRGANSLEEIVECSSYQVSNFVEFIKEKGYLKNTNIVIIGDHLFPLDSQFHNIPKSERFIFNRFISEELPIKNRKEIVHFDLFPTILDYIGLKVKDGSLALGKTAFKDN